MYFLCFCSFLFFFMGLGQEPPSSDYTSVEGGGPGDLWSFLVYHMSPEWRRRDNLGKWPIYNISTFLQRFNFQTAVSCMARKAMRIFILGKWPIYNLSTFLQHFNFEIEVSCMAQTATCLFDLGKWTIYNPSTQLQCFNQEINLCIQNLEAGSVSKDPS